MLNLVILFAVLISDKDKNIHMLEVVHTLHNLLCHCSDMILLPLITLTEIINIIFLCNGF